MSRFSRRPAFETYSPGRKDAPHRIAQARAMLSMRPSLEGLEIHGLACTWNLKDATAALLIEEERKRRGG